MHWLAACRPHPHTAKKIGLAAGAVVGSLGLMFVGALLFMDWNALRGPISRAVSTKLHRPVQIQGDLDVRLGSLTPTISIGRLDIGNPAWAGGGSLMRAEHVTVQVELLPLFKGTLVLPSVRIERPEIHLLRAKDGRTNWTSARKGDAARGRAPNLPVIQRFEMQAGEVTFRDERRELEFKGVATAKETTDGKQSRPFRLSGSGTMNDKPFRFELRGAPLVNVERDQPYPFDADIIADTTHVTARGSVPRPFDLSYVTANFESVGHDLADLYFISGLAFPNTKPYRITGNIAREGTQVAFRNLAGKIGDSDMRGGVTVVLGRERPLVRARVTSQSLDLDDAATWFGASRAQRKDEPLQVRPAARGTVKAARLFPDSKLKVQRVRSMDAEVDYQAATVRSERFPIRALSMNLKMMGGVMDFDPVSLWLPEGKIKGSVRLDATSDVAKTELDARLFGVRLEQFKSKNSAHGPFEGVMRGRVKLTGAGNSIHEFAASSDGTATFVVPRGEVRETLAELSGINVSRALGLMFAKDDDKARIRCGVADLKASDGKLQVQNLVFDTDNVLITGKGDVGLGSEQYDLTIRGQPKKLRLLRLKSPIAIRGPLQRPSVGVEPGSKAVGQTGVAVALGALVTPLAAVVAFVDPGLAKDADCASLLAEAKAGGAPVKTAEIENAPRR